MLRHVLGKWRRWLIRCYQCRELEAHEAAAEAARARLLLQEQDDIADSLRADIVITTVSGIKLMLYLEATGQVGDSPRAVLGGSYVGSTISSATSTAIRRWFKSPRRTDVEAELVNQALSLQAMPLQPLVQPDAPVAGATADAMAGAMAGATAGATAGAMLGAMAGATAGGMPLEAGMQSPSGDSISPRTSGSNPRASCSSLEEEAIQSASTLLTVPVASVSPVASGTSVSATSGTAAWAKDKRPVRRSASVQSEPQRQSSEMRRALLDDQSRDSEMPSPRDSISEAPPEIASSEREIGGSARPEPLRKEAYDEVRTEALDDTSQKIFKEYAPRVFGFVRRELFGVTNAQYIASLEGNVLGADPYAEQVRGF